MSANNFVDELQKGNNLGAEDAFKSSMADRVANALETKRKEVDGVFTQAYNIKTTPPAHRGAPRGATNRRAPRRTRRTAGTPAFSARGAGRRRCPRICPRSAP